MAGDSQTGEVGATLARPLTVKITDAEEQPVPRRRVLFQVAGGGGSVLPDSAITDSLGIAASQWTLGSPVGYGQRVSARVKRLESATEDTFLTVTFSASALPPSSASVTKIGDAQTATVGAAVATPPAVVVLNANQEPIPGASVTFSVASGGGTLTGELATTDDSGVATVGSWTLGTTMGSNTLRATVTGLAPLTFTATGTAGVVAAVRIQAGDGQFGTVGSAVVLPPAVLASDGYGNPVSGTAVTFAVSSGGGSVTGAAATTDARGVATVGGWILGTAPATNTLTATLSGLPPLTFAATGSAGPAALVTKQTGDGQTASLGFAVATPPAVSVTDAYGNPVRGMAVTFTISSGGGSVSGGTRSTDAAGIAIAGGWTLGPTAGTNTLAAAVQGLPAVTFSATAIDPCATATAYTIGSSVTGTLAGDDCSLPYGLHADLYSMTAPSALSVRFDLSSSVFVTNLSLFDWDGSLVSSSSADCSNTYCDLNSSMRVLLSPGDYIAHASTYGSYLGPYTLSSAVVPEDVTGCEWAFVTRGLTTSQRIQSTDCVATFRSSRYFSDQFAIQLTGGQTYTFSMSSTDFDTYLEILGSDLDFGWVVVASNDDFGGTSNSQITFTPEWSGLYLINPATYLGDQTGAYTLVIQ
jgi:hypothetical protein